MRRFNYKALSLTDSGRLLLEYCDRFDGVERDLRTSLAELRDLGSGKLTVGANESTTLYLLEQIAEFRAQHPGVRVEIRRSLSSKIPLELPTFRIYRPTLNNFLNIFTAI